MAETTTPPDVSRFWTSEPPTTQTPISVENAASIRQDLRDARDADQRSRETVMAAAVAPTVAVFAIVIPLVLASFGSYVEADPWLAARASIRWTLIGLQALYISAVFLLGYGIHRDAKENQRRANCVNRWILHLEDRLAEAVALEVQALPVRARRRFRFSGPR